MKKLLLIIISLALLGINTNCGGGSGGSVTDKAGGKANVTINLGVRDKGSSSNVKPVRASSISWNVTTVRFTITARDMPPIHREVPVAGKSTIVESFEVPIGHNRDFIVEALYSLNNVEVVTYRGETFIPNLDGKPRHLDINMVTKDDKSSPSFSGLSTISAITPTSMVLSWLPATDYFSPQDKILYLIYRAETSGGQNFSSPDHTTLVGQTSFPATGLSPVTTYYYVVRSMDEKGNIDQNTIEKSATTLEPPDPEPPTFRGLVSADTISPTEIKLTWNPATDNVTSSQNIVYLIYMATTSDGENYATPNYTTPPGTTSFSVSDLSPGAAYFFVVRARDEAGNIDGNAVEKAAGGFTVTPIVSGTGGVINPSIPQIVPNGRTVSFTVTPDAGYSVKSVISDCGGTIIGLDNVYSVGPITGNCTVTTSFTYVDLQVASINIIEVTEFNCSAVLIVSNYGSDNAMNVPVWVQYQTKTVSHCRSTTILSVPPGSNSVDTTVPLSNCPFEVRVLLNPERTIPETNYQNNCMAIRYDSPGWIQSSWCTDEPPPVQCPY